MIPKPEDILDSSTTSLSKWQKKSMALLMRHYGRRLLDHVGEKCTDDWGNGFTLIEKDEILKIKDEL